MAISDFIKSLTPIQIFNNQRLIFDIVELEKAITAKYLENMIMEGQTVGHPKVLADPRHHFGLQIVRNQLSILRLDYQTLIQKFEKQNEIISRNNGCNSSC